MHERSSLPNKNFPCISMDLLQIGALVLLGRLVEAYNLTGPLKGGSVSAVEFKYSKMSGVRVGITPFMGSSNLTHVSFC